MSTNPQTQDGPEESSLKRFLIDHGEVVLFLVAFAYLAYTATSYEQSARQFPLVFLAVGFIALLFELGIIVLPQQYSAPLRRMTTGLAADMGEELKATAGEDEEETREPVAAEPETDGSEDRKIAITLGLMLGFGVAAYLISFLFAIPVFVLATVHFVGTKNYRRAAIVSAFLMVSVYAVFGELMNVPIQDGVLLELIFG
ncbi:tripartite tricarboxylate transporter TctB family protein [Haladaptatus sp. CMSO5]|uniref:tripartite tricarboxylate transporter TctB family protein n=1 Tax=Haladaptatus sp. CMSO5 TaxID=3120514 RepID=UPI002FCE38B1